MAPVTSKNHNCFNHRKLNVHNSGTELWNRKNERETMGFLTIFNEIHDNIPIEVTIVVSCIVLACVIGVATGLCISKRRARKQKNRARSEQERRMREEAIRARDSQIYGQYSNSNSRSLCATPIDRSRSRSGSLGTQDCLSLI